MNQFIMATTALPLALLTMPALQASDARGIPFDMERRIQLVDTDGDTWPDITEEEIGTDPSDGFNYPFADENDLFDTEGFPGSSCRSGFRQAGSRLCISEQTQNATRYDFANTYCRDKKSRVCNYDDLSYLYYRTSLDASYNPSGKWIGDWVDDDDVFCGNKSVTYDNDPDIYNFEGHCNKTNNRAYWCCHDDDYWG